MVTTTMTYRGPVLAVLVAALIAAVAVHVVAASSDSGGGKCRTASDCHDHGKCVIAVNATEGLCECEERYAGKSCEASRKSKQTAFLLSLLIGGTGADRFYLGYIGLGVAKLLINILSCLPACIGACLGSLCGRRRTEYISIGEDSSQTPILGSLCATAGSCLSCCMVLGTLAWWLTDWILILKDELGDSDGYSLYGDV